MADEITDQTTGFITSTSPLMVRTYGAQTACPATKLASATLSVSDLVQVTLRTPAPPLVQGAVEDS